VGVALVMALPGTRPALVKAAALASSLISLAVSWALLLVFDGGSAELQLAGTSDWVPVEGMSFTLGVDGLSFPLLLLTTLLGTVAILASFGVRERVKGYFAWFLLLEFALIGIFLAQDWFLFFVFYEIALIPMFFLIGMWGGAGRNVAALSFFLYTLGGSGFILLGILGLYLIAPERTFVMEAFVRASEDWGLSTQLWPFLALLVGFAVKIPIFGLHGWLPVAHVESPTPASIMLSAVMLKTGAYGLIRAGETLPLAMNYVAPVILALALVNILYGALLALRATDLKAMVAFSSIGHMGFVLLGLSSLSEAGLTGAINMMVTHGIITGALFLLVGVLYERAHTRDINAFGGLGTQTPVLAVFMSLSLLAAMGLPGLAGFISELNAIVGALDRWGLLVVLASVGILFAAAYSLRTIDRLFLGQSDGRWAGLTDMSTREIVAVAPLAALMVVLGIVPGLALGLMDGTVSELARVFE